MTRKLTRIAPMQLGKVAAVIYGAVSLLIMPIILIGTVISPKAGQPQPKGIMCAFIFLMPLLYAGLSFLCGIIIAFLYNFTARWIGGIEVDVE